MPNFSSYTNWEFDLLRLIKSILYTSSLNNGYRKRCAGQIGGVITVGGQWGLDKPRINNTKLTTLWRPNTKFILWHCRINWRKQAWHCHKREGQGQLLFLLGHLLESLCSARSVLLSVHPISIWNAFQFSFPFSTMEKIDLNISLRFRAVFSRSASCVARSQLKPRPCFLWFADLSWSYSISLLMHAICAFHFLYPFRVGMVMECTPLLQ